MAKRESRGVDRTAEKEIYRQVEDYIADLILTRGLQAGDMIPSPNRLAKKLHVHELTVRRAVRNLQQRQVLTTRQGRGTFVSSVQQLNRVRYVCGHGLLQQDRSPYFTMLLHWLGQALWRANMTIDPLWIGQDPSLSAAHSDSITVQAYRGFLFVATGEGDPLLERVRELRLPYVWWGHCPGPRCIVNNNRRAVEVGLDLLKSRGATQIMVAGMKGVFDEAQSIIATTPASCIVVPTIPDYAGQEVAAYDTMAAALNGHDTPDAILFLDDAVASVATRIILARRDRLPESLQIAILTGVPQPLPLGVPVTYIAFDTPRAAERAVALLRAQIKHEPEADQHDNEVPIRIIDAAANGSVTDDTNPIADFIPVA